MELHEENPFKVKAIANAVFRLDKAGTELEGKTIEELGKVEIVEPMGSQVQIICNVDGESITALFNERLRFSRADTVKLYAMPECIHVFDAATGSRLTPPVS